MSKKLLIAIVAIVLAITIPVTVFVILGKKDEPKLSTPEQYASLEGVALHNMVNSLADVPSLEGKDTAISVDLELIPTDALLSQLNVQDLDWFEKVSLSMDTQMVEGMLDSLMGVGLNGTNIAQIAIVGDPITSIFYMAVPTISDYYMKVDSSDVSISGANTAISNLPAILDSLDLDMTAIKSSLNKYIDAALAEMTVVEKNTETVTIDGKSQKVTVYTNYITEKVFNDMVKAVLKTAKKDATLKSYLPEDVDLDMYIDMVIASLNEDPSTDKDEAVVLKLYTDSKNNVIGRAISVEDTLEAKWLTITDGSATATEIGFTMEYSGFSLINSTTSAGGKCTLSMAEYSSVVELCSFTYTGNAQKGQGELKLSTFVENMIFGSMNVTLSPALKLSWDISDNDAEITTTINISGTDLATLKLTASMGTPTEIQIPDSALDMEDFDAMETYLQSINMTNLLQNIKDAGVPDEIVQLLVSSILGIQED